MLGGAHCLGLPLRGKPLREPGWRPGWSPQEQGRQLRLGHRAGPTWADPVHLRISDPCSHCAVRSPGPWGGASALPSLPEPPNLPCPAQVLAACAHPRADAVGAHAPWGAPGGAGALARCVLRDGAGLDQVGRRVGGASLGAGPSLLSSLAASPTPAAACSPSGSAATIAPTLPSTTASSRSSPRARRPRKCPVLWAPPPPAAN